MEQTRDSVRRYGEYVGRELLNLVVQMRLLALLLVALLTGCFSFGSGATLFPTIDSPSGAYQASPEIFNALVRINVTNLKSGQDFFFQTRASDYQKWALAWSSKNTLVLYSSDIGTYVYDVKDDTLVERMPDADETETGIKAYQQKYGRRPNGR